ncbi:MAG: FAD-dependent oxidoreductase [Chloroflexota bacterium]
MMKQKSLNIVIIGAGILGASIAFNLAERGIKPTILDANDPGQGASRVSFAWINGRDKSPRHYHALNRRSLDMWDRFSRRLGGDVGLTWGGQLLWAATPAEAGPFNQRVKTLQSWGYPVYSLTAAELAAMEPNLASGTVTAASFSMMEGHVNTARVIQECLTRATALGAVVRPQTEVRGIQVGADQTVEAVLVNDGEAIPCDSVVLAGGPDMAALGALVGLDVPLEYTFGATLITEPIAPIFQETAVVYTPSDLEVQIALRQFADGSVMFLGDTAQGTLGQTEAEIDQVIATATTFLPALEGVQIKDIRRGRRPLPRDGHPILGFTQAVPNLYLATMHSGITLSALVGEMAMLEIVEGTRVDIFEPYRLERFEER